MTEQFDDSKAFAKDLDDKDPLAGFRQRFRFPTWRDGHSPIYLCGNSLGLQPDLARSYVEQELDNWSNYAVDGHFHSERPWMSYHRHAARGFAELTGARESEVIAMNTLTVNLHLLMASFYRPTDSRYRIVVEEKAFPSDRYAAASQVRLAGYDADDGVLEWRARGSDGELFMEDLECLLKEHGHSIALLLLPGVQYYSGQVLDMAAICELGRMHGIPVGLDLAHAIGNVEMKLHDWSPDFACWCTYKYLNSGPGAIAGAFIPERHASAEQALHGWWGNAEATRFKMLPDFDPASGAELWQMSNPPILALAPVIASLELFQEAGPDRLRRKSQRLTAYLEWLIARKFSGRIRTITPSYARGCQSSLKVTDPSIDARAVFDRLCELNVTGDWREPDVIRVAPVPLYNSFSDVYEFAVRLERVLSGMSETAMNDRQASNGRSVNVIGAGQCGTLLSIMLARQGFSVDLYERFEDPRIFDAEAGRSINLALAARGINALKQAGIFHLVEPLLVPMRGRVVHQLDGSTEFLPYGQADNEQIYSVTRLGLNKVLLDCAEGIESVRMHFKQAAIGYDAPDRTVHMQDQSDDSLYQVEAAPLFAADGAGSIIRRSFDGSDTFGGIETLLRHGYKELWIPPAPDGSFQMQPDALHIWPRGGLHANCTAQPWW